MFDSSSPGNQTSSATKAPPPGSIPQPRLDGLPDETVPDWNNIGLFTAGIAVGAILGATVALLFAPASGDETRSNIGRRVRHLRGEDDLWDELAQEFERAAAEREEDGAAKVAVET